MAQKQSIDELAKNVSLPNKKTKDVVKHLVGDILISLYRKNPDFPPEMKELNHEMNAKVKQVFARIYKKEFRPEIFEKNKRLPMFLMGPPGQGKTASYIAAAKEVCAEMGLNFVDHVSDSYVPGKYDFVMITQECAGENSAITFGGVPKAEEVEINGKKMTVLKKAINYRFAVLEQCAGGVVLFDDAANAAQVIQNVLLPVAQNGSFQGLKLNNCLVGFTGNLGALDGTYVTEITAALRTRVIPVFVTDTVKDFADRAYSYYNDELGDLGIINFIMRNQKEFAVLPDPGEKSGFACSRSWDNLIQSIRTVVERNGGRGKGEQESLGEIQQLCVSMVGPEIGHKLTAYYQSMIMGADPLARDFMKAESDKEIKELAQRFKEKYKDGSGMDEIGFGYQFATALGDYATNLVVSEGSDSKSLALSMKRFANAALLLNDSEFSFSIEHLKTKIASYITDFSKAKNDGGRELKPEIVEEIVKTIASHPDCGQDQSSIMIKVITDFNKIVNATGVSKIVTKRKAQ